MSAAPTRRDAAPGRDAVQRQDPVQGHDLVVVSLEDWDQVWRRNQYLVAELLRSGAVRRVLFVEPPADPTHAALHRHAPRPGRGLRPAREPGADPARLWLYQPTKPLPRRLDPGFDARRGRLVLRAARRAGLREPTLWINDIGGAPLLDAALPTTYDVTDDWLAAQRPEAERDRLARDEAALLERSDVVTVCSPALARSKGAAREVRLITNGVDAARYRAPAPRPADLPTGRTALYVGTLHTDRLDVELCLATAHALATGSTLVLVGPVALDPADTDRLAAAGVVLLGARPRDAVPGYLQHADVLVVPHRVDAFTESLDPIKLYEYLAVGRPVVSTPVAGFREAPPDRVEIAEPGAFAAAVARRLAQAPREAAPPPPDLPTWERQAGLMAEALDEARRRHRATRP